MQEGITVTNNEKFNQMLNETSNPRRVLAALRALAPILREAKTQQERETLLDSMQEGGEAV